LKIWALDILLAGGDTEFIAENETFATMIDANLKVVTTGRLNNKLLETDPIDEGAEFNETSELDGSVDL